MYDDPEGVAASSLRYKNAVMESKRLGTTVEEVLASTPHGNYPKLVQPSVLEEIEATRKDTPLARVQCNYHVNENGRVGVVFWNDGHQLVKAELIDDTDQYRYTSNLEGDDHPVVAEKSMSLADCILAANVHLGIIPPHNFDPIECPNRH